MKLSAAEKLQKLRTHNAKLRANSGMSDELTPTVHKDYIFDTLESFGKGLSDARSGRSEDTKGNKIAPIDLSFEEGVKTYYGCTPKELLRGLGVYSDTMTITQASSILGYDNLDLTGLQSLLVDHASFGNPQSTKLIPNDFRFIIPELILAAIRTGYEHDSLHQNWIASTQPVSVEKNIIMPRIMRGNGNPTIVNEGANIPMGSVQFGQKNVNTYKVGTGLRITDELVLQSSLDMLSIFLGEVGNDMAISADNVALATLVNGEQADLSESAGVVGVIDNTTGGKFQWADLKRVFTRMRRLKMPASRLIVNEDTGIEISEIPEIKGFEGQAGNSALAKQNSLIGVPEKFVMDTHIPSANQAIFLDPARAMVKLSFRGMKVARRENIQNQTTELFVSDHIGFAIVKRDGRFVLDKSLDYASNGFPDFADIDSRIAQTFEQF